METAGAATTVAAAAERVPTIALATASKEAVAEGTVAAVASLAEQVSCEASRLQESILKKQTKQKHGLLLKGLAGLVNSFSDSQ